MATARNWWSFDNNLHDPIGSNTGTMHYGDFYIPGANNACLDIGTSVSFSDIGTVISQPSSLFAITFWIEFTETPTMNNSILSTQSPWGLYLFMDSTGILYLLLFDTTGTYCEWRWSSATHALLTTPGFNRVELSYNGQLVDVSQRLSLKINGIGLVPDYTSFDTLTQIASSTNFVVGQYGTGGTIGAEVYRLDDLRVYTGVVTSFDEESIIYFLNPNAIIINHLSNVYTGRQYGYSPQPMVLTGVNLNVSPGSTKLYLKSFPGGILHDITDSIIAISNSQLEFTIPDIVPGTYKLYVNNIYGRSNYLDFQVMTQDEQNLAIPYSVQFTLDHVQLALDRLAEQYKPKENVPNITNIVSIGAQRIQDLEDYSKDLIYRLLVSDPPEYGIQLDRLGEIVGIERIVSTDEEYLKLIRGRISANRSRGTREDIIRTYVELTGASFVDIVDNFPAGIKIIANTAPTEEAKLAAKSIVLSALAAGVGLDDTIFNSVDGNFGFSTLDPLIPNDPTILSFGTIADSEIGGLFASIIF